MASALDKLISFSNKKDEPDAFDYIVIINRASASMNVSYLMIDHENKALAPKVMTVKWPRLMEIVDFRATVVKNVLYITGGRDKASGKCVKQVLKYDPEEARW